MSGLFDQKKESDLFYQGNDTYGRGLGILQGIQVSLDSPEPEKFYADAVTKGVLSDAGRGGSVQGVVQCSGKAGKKPGKGQRMGAGADRRESQVEKEVNQSISQLQAHMQELQKIKNEKKNTKSKKIRIEEKQVEIDRCRNYLVQFLNRQYEGHDALIQSLVCQIDRGNYKPITLPLLGHLYEGKPIQPSSTDEATGLHAYSDLSDSGRPGRGNPPGMLPPRIQPLGYIGDQSQVHILHWKVEGQEDPNKTKFSTMLPNTMPEVISKLLFGVASQNVVRTDFDGICIGGSGETMFPLGDDCHFRIF